MLEWPSRSRGLTWLTYAFCVAFFFWIGLEDRSLVSVTLLGACLPIIFVAHFLLRRFGGTKLPVRKSGLLLCAGGLLAGGLAPLTTAVLMAIKVSLHSHPVPDYTPEAVVAVVARLPVWALAGLLAGAALALWAYSRRTPST
jgi:hypothetical protein